MLTGLNEPVYLVVQLFYKIYTVDNTVGTNNPDHELLCVCLLNTERQSHYRTHRILLVAESPVGLDMCPLLTLPRSRGSLSSPLMNCLTTGI